LDRPLRPGNSYRAIVYVPRPSARQLRAAAALTLPTETSLSVIALPAAAGRPSTVAVIPPWGVSEPVAETVAALEASPYARVAAGFSPGAYDAERREYVVRDLDAHSWVEVFFPGIGWVTRDPTPSTSPARSQLGDDTRVAGRDTSADATGAGGAPLARPDS